MDRLLTEGGWNATVIFAEIEARGYGGGIGILRDYIRPKRALEAQYRADRLVDDWNDLVANI